MFYTLLCHMPTPTVSLKILFPPTHLNVFFPIYRTWEYILRVWQFNAMSYDTCAVKPVLYGPLVLRGHLLVRPDRARFSSICHMGRHFFFFKSQTTIHEVCILRKFGLCIYLYLAIPITHHSQSSCKNTGFMYLVHAPNNKRHVRLFCRLLVIFSVYYQECTTY